MNGIHPNYRINIVQATRTPRFYFRKYPVSDGTDCFGRHTVTKILFHPVAYFTCTITKGIKADYAVSNTFRKNGLPLLYKLRIEAGITITGCRNGHLTHRSLHLLLHLAITTVATHAFILGKMGIHLTF